MNNSSNIAHEKSKSFILSSSGSAPSFVPLKAVESGCVTGWKELMYGFDWSHTRETVSYGQASSLILLDLLV